ncbi:MAG: radical SAM protein [Thermosphaera sp.]
MFRNLIIIKQRVTTGLSKSGLPGLDYALNPYIGCSHSCIYCYARQYTRDKRVSENWGHVIIVKENLTNILLSEVKRLKKGVVGVGTITDAYQPVEAAFKLTRRAVEILVHNGFHVSIQTKNPLVLRDKDVLSANKSIVDVGFTITTISCDKSRIIEPNAPCPEARINAVRTLSREKFNTWVFYGPIIPSFNDDDKTITALVELSHETGSTLFYDPLRFKPFMVNLQHPLSGVFVAGDLKQRLKETINRLKRKCLEYGVSCRGGFEY